MSNSRETLLAAAQSGDVEKLKVFGPSPEKLLSEDLKIEDLLAVGAQANQPSIVEFCLKSGAKITPQVELAACNGGGVEVYRLLLPLGLPQLNGSITAAGGVIVNAVSNDDLLLLTFLLENGADPDDGGRFEWMPAIAVAMEEKKDLETIKLLVKHGANVKSKGLLALAANEGRVDIVEYLLDLGVEIDEDVEDCVLLPHDKGSALGVAASMEQLDVVRILVERKADVWLKDSDGRSALDKAGEAGYSDIVTFLESCRT
jgi:ankyrin repeat protein